MNMTIPYTNNTKQPQNIAGKTVLPGETREVDARFAPATAKINRALMILFINFAQSARYFGETVVQPGQTARLSIIHFENPNCEGAGVVQDQIFNQLLEKKIGDIKPYFSELTDTELNRLIELEAADANRKTLLENIKDELAVRQAEREFSPATYAKALDAMDDEELQLELLSVGDDSRKIDAIENELAKRQEQKKEQQGA